MKRNLVALNILAWITLAVGGVDFAQYVYGRVEQSSAPNLASIAAITSLLILGVALQIISLCLKAIDRRLSK